MEIDLLNLDPVAEEGMNKLKRLVQSPNSYFMDVKCPQCFIVSTIFSHAQTAVTCEKYTNLVYCLDATLFCARQLEVNANWVWEQPGDAKEIERLRICSVYFP